MRKGFIVLSGTARGEWAPSGTEGASHGPRNMPMDSKRLGAQTRSACGTWRFAHRPQTVRPALAESHPALPEGVAVSVVNRPILPAAASTVSVAPGRIGRDGRAGQDAGGDRWGPPAVVPIAAAPIARMPDPAARPAAVPTAAPTAKPVGSRSGRRRKNDGRRHRQRRQPGENLSGNRTTHVPPLKPGPSLSRGLDQG
jgi:hypothetical protein